MYRIVHHPTETIVAHTSAWRDAAEALRAHSAVRAGDHNDQTYKAVTADPSVILHLTTMGDGEYTIQRDECDLMICDTCGDLIGMVTSQSDNYPHGKGSWQISCCTPCAQKWEDTYPDEPSDFRSHEISRTVVGALVIPPMDRRYTLARIGDTITVTMPWSAADDLSTVCDIIREDDDDPDDATRAEIVRLCSDLRRDLCNIL